MFARTLNACNNQPAPPSTPPPPLPPQEAAVPNIGPLINGIQATIQGIQHNINHNIAQVAQGNNGGCSQTCSDSGCSTICNGGNAESVFVSTTGQGYGSGGVFVASNSGGGRAGTAATGSSGRSSKSCASSCDSIGCRQECTVCNDGVCQKMINNQ